MFSGLAKKFFGSANDRYLKGLDAAVAAINALEPELESLSDGDLAARTDWLRSRLDQGEGLDDLLVDAFATVREGAKRTLGQRHFDVQLMGGIVLHRGMISEMKTGEGKTLVATLAVYLNALTGKGVHVVTVNDYLAKRDAEWMGQIYRFLGLSVGCIVAGLQEVERRAAYACDVTYGTNNEFGFDYLRDNMKFRLEEMVQREFAYAIVDEVDSILIDEARTPLIISGPTEDSSEMYLKADKVIPRLDPEHYEKDEKVRAVTLTEEGTERVEEILRDMELLDEGSLYDLGRIDLLHHVTQALRAHVLFQPDTDYIVKDDQVIIIDEFTGRMMEGRRYSDGLHQALEAKEGVTIQQENQTLASITYQNYFRLYPKLAGMTGTAMTEASEFLDIYSLEVVEIPTNVPCIRLDEDDQVYRTAKEKFNAIIEQIETCRERRQPILVGTVSIEKSELLSDHLKKRKIPHEVLNARHHEKEAYIIAQAGQPGAVTIATNMAGRGTDIQLGGNLEMRLKLETDKIEDENKKAAKAKAIEAEIAADKQKVLDSGGLYIIGTERHESRRIDNQLRGRAGRQGDPGASQFFLSLEDDLMRIFGSQRMDGMLRKLGLQEGEAIVHPWVNKALEKAQSKVEAHHFEARKNVLKFDDVMNDQRKVIYQQRKEMMQAEEVKEEVASMRQEVLDNLVAKCIPPQAYADQWNVSALHTEFRHIFGIDAPIEDWAKEEGIADKEIRERLADLVERRMAAKTANYTPQVMRSLEKQLLLMVLDKQWKDHLLSLDHLRHAIHLRAYAQKDPLNEYKRESFELFDEMLAQMRVEVTRLLSLFEIRARAPEEAMPQRRPQVMHETREDPAELESTTAEGDGSQSRAAEAAATRPVRSRMPESRMDPKDPSTWGRVSRNAACPCGSGKKYKRCHGSLS